MHHAASRFVPTLGLLLTILAAITLPATAAPTRVVTPEEADLLRGILAARGGELDPAQSFRVDLPVSEARYLIALTGIEDPDGQPTANFLVLDPRGTVLQTLTPHEHWSHLSGIEAVSFTDMNADGHPDVTFILSWMTGIGPTGAQDFNAPSIHLFDPDANKYAPAPALLEAAPHESSTSIKAIKAHLSGGK